MKKALLIVDVQNDFCPGGALAVQDGNRIVPVINELQKKFELVVASQDWHPAGHSSFASTQNRQPGETIELNGLPQMLWPDHCVQGTKGAELEPTLDQTNISKIVHKGTDPEIDSYSAFFDNAKRKKTELESFLKQEAVGEIYIAGLATDYCVKFTAIDAVELGFKTYVIEDATKGIDVEKGVPDALAKMKQVGIHMILSKDVLRAV